MQRFIWVKKIFWGYLHFNETPADLKFFWLPNHECECGQGCQKLQPLTWTKLCNSNPTKCLYPNHHLIKLLAAWWVPSDICHNSWVITGIVILFKMLPKGLDSSRHITILKNNTMFCKNMFQQNLLSSLV